MGRQKYYRNPDEEFELVEQQLILHRDLESMRRLMAVGISNSRYPPTLLHHLEQILTSPPSSLGYQSKRGLLERGKFQVVRVIVENQNAEKLKGYRYSSGKFPMLSWKSYPTLEFIVWTPDEAEAAAMGELIAKLHGFQLPNLLIDNPYCLPRTVNDARRYYSLGLREDLLLNPDFRPRKEGDPDPFFDETYRPYDEENLWPPPPEEYRHNPDELEDLEQQYVLTGDTSILNRLNTVRTSRNMPILYSQEQVLEHAWREIDSEASQFLLRIWSTYELRELIYQDLMRRRGLDPDQPPEEGSPNQQDLEAYQEILDELRDIEEQYQSIQRRRSIAFDKYMNHLLRRPSKRRL